MPNTNIKEKFKKLFFEKRWLSTKDKEISEVAFDGIWNFIESTISQTRKEGYQSGVNDQAGQYKEYVEEEKKKARQEVIEEMIDDIIKLSSRYWIDRYMGSPTPLIVNKGQFKRFLLEDLNKK